MKFFRWKQRKEEDLNAEIQSHLDMAMRDRMERGESAEQANANARREFGNVGLVKEVTREMWGWASLERLWQDLRFGLRMLRKNPGFSMVAILTLALGIGANTAIFSLLNAIVFRPLPVRNPGQVVNVHQSFRHIGEVPREVRGAVSAFSYPEVSTYQDNKSLAGLAAYVGRELTLDGPAPESIRGTLVSESYFAVLGAETVAGRTFGGPEVAGRDAFPLAVLSHRFWQRRFGGDPEIIGKAISLNRMDFTVVGVADQKFIGTEAAIPDVWVPLATENLLLPERDNLTAENRSWLRMVGRLKPGVSAKQAEAELQVITSQLDRKFPGRSTRLIVTRSSFFNDPAQMLRLAAVIGPMFAVTTMILILACANVANLLLARAVGRQQEIAVRLILGASRARLIRLLLIENAFLSLLGGTVAVLLTSWTLKAMLLTLASALDSALRISDSALVLDVGADWRVVGVALLLSSVAAVTVGLVPALRATELNLATAVKDQGSTLGLTLSRARLRSALVVVQIAVSLVLLTGTGLLIRSLQNANFLALGFTAKDVLDVNLTTPYTPYDAARATVLNRLFAQRAEAIPGVRSVAMADQAPLSGYNETNVSTEESPSGPHQAGLAAHYNSVSGNYFQALGIPLVRGRGFSEEETRTSAPVAIISETMARRLWPGKNPLRNRFIKSGQRFEVIGVAKDTVSSSDLSKSDAPQYYLPLSPGNGVFLIRTNLAPSVVIPSLRALARELDANARIEAHSLDEYLERAIAPMRMETVLASALGILALFLATMGTYGLASFNVSQQTREFGIRLALGAQERDLIGLVLRRNLRQVALGIIIGLMLSVAVTPLLSSFLVGLPPIEPVALLGVSVLLTAATALACYLPARKTARVDPLVTLRCD